MFRDYMFYVVVFLHSSNKHLLNVNYVSITVLGAGESGKRYTCSQRVHNLENFGRQN